jgi:dolichol-phosphate mannosyltransferase
MLERLPLAEVESQGYCFQVDMTQRVHRAGGRIVEVPITFVERRLGESKMSREIVAEALWRVTQWGLQRRWRRLRAVLVGPTGRRHGRGSAHRAGLGER